MKRNHFIIYLSVLAAGGAVLGLTADGGRLLPSLLAFPFAQFGSLLRTLSLSGAVGNAAAWVLLAAAASVPLLLYLWLRHTRRAEKADVLTAMLSPVLAVVLYKMVNPFGSVLTASDAGLSIYKAQYGAVVYVILVGWVVLRIVSRFAHAEQGDLYRWLRRFVILLAALFALGLGSSLGDLKGTVEAVAAANTNTGSLNITYLFLGLQWAVNALPLLLDTAAAVLALGLLDAMAADSEAQGAAAERLADWCRVTLIVTVAAGIGFHVLQMLCMDALRHVDSSVVLPVGSLAFLLICMTAARIIAENKALRDENDLYI